MPFVYLVALILLCFTNGSSWSVLAFVMLTCLDALKSLMQYHLDRAELALERKGEAQEACGELQAQMEAKLRQIEQDADYFHQLAKRKGGRDA